VLGLVLGLNLGLGRLCRKVGSIAALCTLHAGSFSKISLSWLYFTVDIKTGLGL